MIQRAPREKNFTIILNETLRDTRLSFRARGVLAYVLSMPDDWQTSCERLAEVATEGRDAIRTAVKELEDRGYIKRSTERNERGQLRTKWLVHDTPIAGNPPAEIPLPARPAETDESPGRADRWKPAERRARSHTKTDNRRCNTEDPCAAPASQPAAGEGQAEFFSQGEPKPKPSKPKSPAKAKTPLRLCAEEIANHVWENRHPRPSGLWIAWVKIFEDLLDRGQDPETLRAAAMTSSIIASKSLEIEIDRMKPRRNGTGSGRLQGAALDDAYRDFARRHGLFGQGGVDHETPTTVKELPHGR